MNVLPKVLGLTVAGVAVILLYVSGSVGGALMGPANPMAFLVYVGLALTAILLAVIVVMTTGHGAADDES
jgi:multisubunit Na+/H+ antiporter MnhC subunit